MKKDDTIFRQFFLAIIGVAFLTHFLIPQVHSANGKRVELITVQEAGIPDPPPRHFEAERPLAAGPIVEVVSPQNGKTYKSPVPIQIRFQPRDGKEIDLSSFKVELLKLFTIDITYKLLPYTSKDGINLPEADIPPGKHMIRVSLGDVTGGITNVLLVVSVPS